MQEKCTGWAGAFVPASTHPSVKITNWDQWQVSGVFQVFKPADGRWTLDAWTDIDRGTVEVTPADEIPLSVV